MQAQDMHCLCVTDLLDRSCPVLRGLQLVFDVIVMTVLPKFEQSHQCVTDCPADSPKQPVPAPTAPAS